LQEILISLIGTLKGRQNVLPYATILQINNHQAARNNLHLNLGTGDLRGFHPDPRKL
jgi:hypothetical protein